MNWRAWNGLDRSIAFAVVGCGGWLLVKLVILGIAWWQTHTLYTHVSPQLAQLFDSCLQQHDDLRKRLDDIEETQFLLQADEINTLLRWGTAHQQQEQSLAMERRKWVTPLWQEAHD